MTTLKDKLIKFLKDRDFAENTDDFTNMATFYEDIAELKIYKEYMAFPSAFNSNLLYYEFFIKYSSDGQEYFLNMYNTCNTYQSKWYISSITHKYIMTRISKKHIKYLQKVWKR